MNAIEDTMKTFEVNQYSLFNVVIYFITRNKGDLK